MKNEIRLIRSVLNSLARVENADNDTKELVYDRELQKIRNLDRQNILEIVNEAVGTDLKRIKYSPFIYSEFSDVLGIEQVFEELLSSADAAGRAGIIQTIGLNEMRGLVGALNDHFTREEDDFCRNQLLHVLGRLADESSLPIFEYLMRNDSERDQWRILCAAQNYARPEFLDYQLRVFSSPETQKSSRVMAAWGLAKLGNSDAYDYLVEMLDDPERTYNDGEATVFDAGQAVRAAQALADVKGWDFAWSRNSVAEVKNRLRFV